MTPLPDTILARASRAVLHVEGAVGALLVLVILAAILAGSIGRGLARPLVWTDELAVHLMVWLAFIGASMGVGLGNHMVMGLLPERMGPAGQRAVALLCDGLVLVFLLGFALLVWRWLDLPGLIRAGSPQALARQSYNFVWLDPTLTLGLRKIWFWLIVPVSTMTAILHVLARIAAGLSRRERAA